jgi:hypothetical protein
MIDGGMYERLESLLPGCHWREEESDVYVSAKN